MPGPLRAHLPDAPQSMDARHRSPRICQFRDVKRRVISTGSAEIDKKMGGGIPEGSLILIEGSSNAGKSVVTQQLIYGALNSGFRCVLYTTENTPRSLFRQMSSLSLDILDFYLLGAFNVYPVPAAMSPEAADHGVPQAARPHRLAPGQVRRHLHRLADVVRRRRCPRAATLQFLTAIKESRRREHDHLLHAPHATPSTKRCSCASARSATRTCACASKRWATSSSRCWRSRRCAAPRRPPATSSPSMSTPDSA